MITNKIKKIIVLLSIIIININCKKNNDVEDKKLVNSKEIVTENKNDTQIDKKNKFSFVISCGGGCAMVYSENKRTFKNSTIEIEFKIETYINEVLSETFEGIYLFDCKNNNINHLYQGNLELIENDGSMFSIELEKIKESLCSSLSKNDETTKDNTLDVKNKKIKILLKPYNNRIDIDNVTYKRMFVNETRGLSDFACGNENIRYIAFYKKDKINLILIPMDCGDTPYRYYLISIFNNSVVSNLYVEGDLYEPESINSVEKTNFSIDENSVLTVKTINKEFKNKIEVKKYEILENGEILQIL